MYNVYETEHVKKFANRHFDMGGYDDHRIVFPKHVLVCSGTGGGKSNWLAVYLQQTAKGGGTFGHVTIVCKALEPIYEALQSSLKEDLTIHTSLSQLPALNAFPHKNMQQLLVFDDCVADKDQSKIEEYFLRGRKHGSGVQCIYLSQSYFKTPIFIRNQVSYLIFLTVSSDSDISRIVSNYATGATVDVVKRLFKNATREKFCFFKIDVSDPNPNTKYSRNWTDFYRIQDEDGEPIPVNELSLFTGSGIIRP